MLGWGGRRQALSTQSLLPPGISRETGLGAGWPRLSDFSQGGGRRSPWVRQDRVQAWGRACPSGQHRVLPAAPQTPYLAACPIPPWLSETGGERQNVPQMALDLPWPRPM